MKAIKKQINGLYAKAPAKRQISLSTNFPEYELFIRCLCIASLSLGIFIEYINSSES